MNARKKANSAGNKISEKKVKELKSRLEEAEQTLDAIRNGYIDALIDSSGKTTKIFTIEGAETAYRIMVETMNEGALTLDSDGVILYANARFSTLSGISSINITGRNFREFILTDSQNGLNRILDQTARGERSHCDLMLKNIKGSSVPVYVSSAPLYLDSRTNICIVVTDLTERKMSEERLWKLNSERQLKAQLKTILENISDAVMVFSDDGNLVQINAAAVKMGIVEKDNLGNSFKKFAGKFEFFDSNDNGVPPEHRPISRGLNGETLSGIEYRVVNTKENTGHYYKFSVAPVFGEGENIQMVVVSVHDITGQKINEIALEKAKQISEQKAAQLDVLNKELESFSYSVAHDLRNPLFTARTFADILIGECSERLNEECNDYLKRIKNSADRMNSIIDDLLALAKISRQEIVLVDFDMSGAVHLFVNELSESNPGRRVNVQIQEGLRVRADARLISAALRNLLSNAWKYTSKVEHPEIEFGSFEKDGQQIYYVKDNGAGFDMKLASKLFVPFQRLHAEKEFSGTGIGLAIAARAIGRHSGKIWAESEPGKGAVFFFTLGK